MSTKIYKTGYKLLRFISYIGFKRQWIDTEDKKIKFYTNKKGMQIHIDFRKHAIRLIDNKGYTLKKVPALTEQELRYFAKGQEV